MRENIKVDLQQIKEYESPDWQDSSGSRQGSVAGSTGSTEGKWFLISCMTSSISRRPLLYGMSEFHSA
jgi:hypothetical protein